MSKFRYKFFVLITTIAFVFMTGCRLNNSTTSEKAEREMLIGMISEDVISKNTSYDSIGDEQTNCLYIDAILSSFASGEEDRIVSLFANAAVDALGADTIVNELRTINDSIEGDILHYTIEPSGGSGHRGGEGASINRYIGKIYTTEDIYSFGYQVCDGYSFEDVNDREDYYHLWGFNVYQMSRYFYEDLEYYTVIKPESDMSLWDWLERDGINDPHDCGAFAVNGDFSELTAYQRIIEEADYSAYSYVYLITNIDSLPVVSTFDNSKYPETCDLIMQGVEEQGFVGDISNISQEYDSQLVFVVTDSAGNDYRIVRNWDDSTYEVSDDDYNLLFTVPMIIG